MEAIFGEQASGKGKGRSRGRTNVDRGRTRTASRIEHSQAQTRGRARAQKPSSRGARIRGSMPRSRGSTRNAKPPPSEGSINIEAQDDPPSPPERTLKFLDVAEFENDEDTTTIALNLINFFLRDEHWLPELSYLKLPASCFYFASLLTNKNNTAEMIAESLGSDSALVSVISGALSEGEDSATRIRDVISVTVADVDAGYALLYERKEQFATLIGPYATGLAELPSPILPNGDAKEVVEDEEDFDILED